MLVTGNPMSRLTAFALLLGTFYTITFSCGAGHKEWTSLAELGSKLCLDSVGHLSVSSIARAKITEPRPREERLDATGTARQCIQTA